MTPLGSCMGCLQQGTALLEKAGRYSLAGVAVGLLEEAFHWG